MSIWLCSEAVWRFYSGARAVQRLEGGAFGRLSRAFSMDREMESISIW